MIARGISNFLIAGSILAVFLTAGCAQNKGYQTAKIERGDLESTVSCTGTLQFYSTNNVIAQVSGIVSRVYADFNKKVSEGQLLAAIDTTTLRLDMQTAEQNLNKSKVALDQAQRDLDDTKELCDKNFKSSNDLQTAQYALDTARITYRSSQIDLEKARLNLENAAITSPVSGTVVQRNIDVGQSVNANSTLLFVIASDISRLQILASVDENDISQVKAGQTVRFTVQAYSDRKFEGTVAQIRLQPQVVQNVVNYTVVVDVDNKGGFLLPGMTATLDLVTDLRTNVLKVPLTALKFRPPVDVLRNMFSGSGNGNGGRWNGGGGGTNRGGGGNWTNAQRDRQNGGMLWTLDTNTGKLRPVRVKTGMSDNQMMEVTGDNITDGVLVVTGMATNSGGGGQQQNRSLLQNMTGGGGGFRGGR